MGKRFSCSLQMRTQALAGNKLCSKRRARELKQFSLPGLRRAARTGWLRGNHPRADAAGGQFNGRIRQLRFLLFVPLNAEAALLRELTGRDGRSTPTEGPRQGAQHHALAAAEPHGVCRSCGTGWQRRSSPCGFGPWLLLLGLFLSL